MSLILANGDDLVVGRAAPWPLYDGQRAILLPQGEIVRDEAHRAALLDSGACYELAWQAPVAGEAGDQLPLAADEPVLSNDESAKGDSFTFDDMRLKAEDRLQLEPPQQLSRERFAVKVIGFLRGISLLVTMPITANGLRLQLMENEKVVMRSFSGQNAFGFACTIQRIGKLPFDYLHLTFPDNIQGIMVRKAPRIKTRIIAAVRDAGSEAAEQLSALISDISASGVSLEAKRPLGAKDDMLHLAFRVQLHSVEAYLSLKGVIRAVLGSAEADGGAQTNIRHGIEFQELQPNDRIILQSMIYQQMIENPQRVL